MLHYICFSSLSKISKSFSNLDKLLCSLTANFISKCVFINDEWIVDVTKTTPNYCIKLDCFARLPPSVSSRIEPHVDGSNIAASKGKYLLACPFYGAQVLRRPRPCQIELAPVLVVFVAPLIGSLAAV